MADNKYSRWSVTVFEEQYSVIEEAARDSRNFKEVAWQDEIAPDTGRKHRQGYCVTQTPTRFNSIKKLLPGIHVEPAKNFNALKKYCSKLESRDPAGSSSAVTHPSTHVTVDRFMELIALEYIELLEEDDKFDWDAWHDTHEDFHDNPVVAKNVAVFTSAYWKLVKLVLMARPELAALAMAPGPRSLWMATASVWVRRALASRTRGELVLQSPAQGGVEGPDKIEHD